MRRAPLSSGLAMGALLLLSSCGSTAASTSAGGASLQTGGQGLNAPAGTTGQGSANGLGGPSAGDGRGGTSGGLSGSGTEAGGGGAIAGTTGGASAGATGAAATTGGGTTGGPGAAVTVGPGITATKIFVGVAYFPDAATTNKAIGAGGADSGDQRDYYNAVIDDLNKRGGVRGRKVVPNYFEYSSTSGESTDSQDQRACDQWTKDNKVFAITFRGPLLQQCARKAGILILSGDGEAGPAFARVPNMVDPGAVRLERLAASTVSGLDQQSYFKPTTEWPTGKVGLISWDNPSYRYGVTSGYVPALKKLGRTAQTSYVAIPQSANSIADAGAAVSSAVLSFKAAGIDHVFIQDGPAGVFGGAGLTLLFLNNAKSQSYRPRYGFNANNVPGYSIYPSDQQHGMLAVDYTDYMPEQDAGIAPSAGRQHCFDIMKKHGVTPSDQNTYGTAASACDQIWFLEALLDRATAPTLQAVLAVVDGLGTAYRSPLVYGSRLGPGQHDGGYLARSSMYDDTCKCMKYTSKPYAP